VVVDVPEHPTATPIFELYKLAVEMADRVSARRASANALFVGIQTASVASLGFLAARRPPAPDGFLVAICAVGVIGAGAWFLLLRSYRDLNRAKFNVILKLEDQLPVRIYGEEWQSLKMDPVKAWRKRYAELGTLERLAPALYAALNIAMAAYVVVS
jgi:hypothetical protein